MASEDREREKRETRRAPGKRTSWREKEREDCDEVERRSKGGGRRNADSEREVLTARKRKPAHISFATKGRYAIKRSDEQVKRYNERERSGAGRGRRVGGTEWRPSEDFQQNARRTSFCF